MKILKLYQTIIFFSLTLLLIYTRTVSAVSSCSSYNTCPNNVVPSGWEPVGGQSVRTALCRLGFQGSDPYQNGCQVGENIFSSSKSCWCMGTGQFWKNPANPEEQCKVVEIDAGEIQDFGPTQCLSPPVCGSQYVDDADMCDDGCKAKLCLGGSAQPNLPCPHFYSTYDSQICLYNCGDHGECGADNDCSDVNFGNYNSMSVSKETTTTPKKAVLKFNLASIPQDATINLAALRLFVDGWGGDPGNIKVYKIKKSWDEGQVTWNNPWDLPGCVGSDDCDTVESATVFISNTGYTTLDLTNLVRAWVSTPSENNGIILIAQASNTGFYISSSEDDRPNARPCLEIDYTLPCQLIEANITRQCSGDGIPTCSQGEKINLQGKLSGTCTGITHFQINANDSFGSCYVRYSAGNISGIYNNTAPLTINGDIITGSWTIPSIPDVCCGKRVNATIGRIYTGGNPFTGTLIDDTNDAGDSVDGDFWFEPCVSGTTTTIATTTAAITGTTTAITGTTTTTTVPPGSICCQTEPGGQKRCWSTGKCCNKGYTSEHWSPGLTCYDFALWTSGARSFRVGEKTTIFLYLQNNGSYVDSYDISYNIQSTNPSLILVDMTDVSYVSDVKPNDKKILQPKITVLSTTADGTITFTAASRGDNLVTRSASMKILQSDYLFSLPEFQNFMILLIIVLSATITIIYSKNYYLKK